MPTESEQVNLTTTDGEKLDGWYRNPDGIYVPSVTEVLGLLAPELSGWAAGIASKAVYKAAQAEGVYDRSTKSGITQAVAERTGRAAVETAREAAAAVGTDLHEAAWAVFDGGSRPPETRQASVALDNFRQWYADTGPDRVRLVASEAVVYGDGYAGRLDGVVVVDGAAGVVELKTTRETLPVHAMQAAAYRAAWTREGRRPRLTWAAVLRLDKHRAGYEMAMVNHRRALAAFKAVLKTYFSLRGRVYEF